MATFADPTRMPEDRFAEAVEEVQIRDSRPYAHDAFLQSLRGLLRTYFDVGANRPWKLAQRVKPPPCSCTGERIRCVDPRTAHRATKYFPNAHVVVLPDSGHVAQMEHPEFVEAAWDRFIGSCRSPLRFLVVIHRRKSTSSATRVTPVPSIRPREQHGR